MSPICVPLDKKVVDLSSEEVEEIRMRQKIIVEEYMTSFNRIFFPGYEPKGNYNNSNRK